MFGLVKQQHCGAAHARLDWIRRFILFQGKRQTVCVETYLRCLDGILDCSSGIDERRPISAMERNAPRPELAGHRNSRDSTECLLNDVL